MKQKLGLAAALVHQPRALLLDEPTTGVDPVTRQDFWQLIIKLVANGQESGEIPAVLVSTPYMDEAARCTRVGFLHQGRLVLEGSPAELRSTLDGQILELTGHPMKVLRKSLHALEHVEDVQMFGDRLHIRVAAGKADQVISEIGNLPVEQARVTRLRLIKPQLEDVFMTLVAPGERREPGR
jgi:ABC-2 type transport system ATP-binding protein